MAVARRISARDLAVRGLQLVLPVCLLAAATVAVLGLFRVVSRPATQPVSQQSPTLRLGGAARSTAMPLPSAELRPVAAAPRPTPEPARLTSQVMVVNASTVKGLAGRTAAALRRRGVIVASIGNLDVAARPVIRTVFYPPGDRGQARTLASISGAAVVAPAPRWLQPDGKLVLVVTDAPPTS